MKAEKRGPAGGGDDVTTCSDSTAGFSGFTPTSAIHCLSSDDSDSPEEKMHGSVLVQCANAFGPLDKVSAKIDGQVADMVNQMFDNGLREEEYKEILNDDSTKKHSNCHALAIVECNSQILDALRLMLRKQALA